MARLGARACPEPGRARRTVRPVPARPDGRQRRVRLPALVRPGFPGVNAPFPGRRLLLFRDRQEPGRRPVLDL